MPVLDVYPDALSAPMPVDLVPVIVPPTPLAAPRGPGRPDLPDLPRPHCGRAADRAADSGRGRSAQPPSRADASRHAPAAGTQSARTPVSSRSGRPRSCRPAHPTRPTQPASGRTHRPRQGRPMSAGRRRPRCSAAASVSRAGGPDCPSRPPIRSRRVRRRRRPSRRRRRWPPSTRQRGQVRNTARDQAQERRADRAAPLPSEAGSSTWAVIGVPRRHRVLHRAGQKIIDLVTELFNR